MQITKITSTIAEKANDFGVSPRVARSLLAAEMGYRLVTVKVEREGHAWHVSGAIRRDVLRFARNTAATLPEAAVEMMSVALARTTSQGRDRERAELGVLRNIERGEAERAAPLERFAEVVWRAWAEVFARRPTDARGWAESVAEFGSGEAMFDDERAEPVLVGGSARVTAVTD